MRCKQPKATLLSVYTCVKEPDSNAAGMCAAAVLITSQANLFLLFIGKERTSMAVPRGAKFNAGLIMHKY